MKFQHAIEESPGQQQTKKDDPIYKKEQVNKKPPDEGGFLYAYVD